MGRIADMATTELLELVRTGELDEGAVLEILRNPYCTPEVAEHILGNRRWLSSHVVRERLAGFPGVGFSRALGLLANLPWLSLLHLAQNPRTPPMVRRHAERRLLNHLPQMALGEVIALARLAHRPLLRALIATDQPRVQLALLDNPRLVENDVLLLLNREGIGAEVLLAVTRHRRWGRAHAVRLRMVVHPALPLPVALSLLVELGPVELRDLSARPDVPEPVRTAAAELAERKGSASQGDGGTIPDR